MKTFKQHLSEQGIPFANVNNPEKITVYGHTELDLVDPPKATDEDEKKKKTELRKGSKLFQFLAHAKNIND